MMVERGTVPLTGGRGLVASREGIVSFIGFVKYRVHVNQMMPMLERSSITEKFCHGFFFVDKVSSASS